MSYQDKAELIMMIGMLLFLVGLGLFVALRPALQW